MPLSFRRRFQKRPSDQLARNKRRLNASSQLAPRLRAAAQLRAPRYPLGALVGAGVLVVITAVVIANTSLAGKPAPPAITPTPTPALATPRYETAVAARLATLAAPTATQPPTPSSTPVLPTSTAAPTATLAASATQPPSNAWAAQIPAAACIPQDLPQTGVVVGIVDGNTIRVRPDGDERVYSVRYIGVQAPQRGQYYAALSEAANSELAYLKQVTLVRDLTNADPQGTLPRYVMAGRTFINYELIVDGYAQAVASRPDTACLSAFRAAQQSAENAKLGMWAGPAYLIPILPTP
jgi:endonuclease YncB( thermonuclease family)